MPRQKGGRAGLLSDPGNTSTPSLPGHAGLAGLYARPGFLFRRAHQISVAVFDKECAGVDLTAPQHSTLFAIARCPGVNQSELARVLGLDRATMGQILGGLEARGLIGRTRSPSSRRVVSIDITAPGQALLDAAATSVRRTTRRLLSPLDTDEREVLLGLVRKIVAALNDDAKSPIASRARAARAPRSRAGAVLKLSGRKPITGSSAEG